MKKNSLTRLSKFALAMGLILLMAATTEGGDSKDINNRLIATTIAVDKRDGQIWFYLEFANIQQGQSSGGGGAKKYILVKSKGETLPEVRADLDRQLDRPLFLSEVRTLILTEDFAKDHLVEYLYRLRADESYRKKVLIVTTRDNLDALFKSLNERDVSLGYSIENTLATLEGLGGIYTRTTSRLLENLSDTYTGILIPCIGMQDQQSAVTGYSVVHDDRVTGFIPIESCKGLNLLKTDKAINFYVIPYKQFQLTVEAVLTDRKVKATYENGKPAFKFSLKFDATLEYGDKKIPYKITDADSQAVSGILKQIIEQDVRDAIYQAQYTFKTDYLQLDDAFRVAYPEVYDSMDWNVSFGEASIAAEVEVNLKPTYLVDYSVDVNR